MNEALKNEWDNLAKKNYIFTKHNYLSVYNFNEIRKNCIEEIHQEMMIKEGFSDIQVWLQSLKDLTSLDKTLFESEVDKRLKTHSKYVKAYSECKRVNKYKSKAYEVITKYLLDEYFECLQPENSFYKIFQEIDEDLNRNKDTYFESNLDFEILPLQERDKFKFLKLKLKNSDSKIYIGLTSEEQFKTLKYLNKGSIITKDFFEDDSNTYLFKVNYNCPILAFNGKYTFFYKVGNEIKFKLAESFDEILKLEGIYGQINMENFSVFKQYCILSTPKQFKEKYFINSKLLKSLNNHNYIKNYRLKPLLRDYNHKKRPDMWQYENNELLFFEVKFNEFGEFNREYVSNTVNYVRQFNDICKREGSELCIKQINLIHNGRSLTKEILELIKNYKDVEIKVISFFDLIEESSQSIPSAIKVYKKGNKTIRELEFSTSKPENIVIDLLEVTNE